MASFSFTRRLTRSAILSSSSLIGLVLFTSLASAQVAYDERPILDPFSPYDESYGVSPSFQIFPRNDGLPAVRVVQHCQNPNGWNVTDFGRDVNGTPAGVEHACGSARIRERN